MTKKLYNFLSIALLVTATHLAQAAVDDIVGDTGTAQAGALTITGASTGLEFNTASSTITLEANYLALPITSSTVGQIIIGGDPVFHVYGTSNSNTFAGCFAGNFTTTGSYNFGGGCSSLNVIDEGSYNTALGHASLISLEDGSENVALGASAGSALVDGSNNILIGVNAGSAYSGNESGNIVIGAIPAVASENYTIRLGDIGTHTDCYVAGIYDQSVDSELGTAVYVDDQGKLGSMVSSAEYKEQIRPIGNDSKKIFELKPVSFVLKKDKKKRKQYGLVAEQVAEVFPQLVIYKDGQPHSVRYQELPVLTLNEVQRLEQRVVTLENKVQKIMSRLDAIEAKLRK